MRCIKTAALVTFMLLLLSASITSAATITGTDGEEADYTGEQAALP